MLVNNFFFRVHFSVHEELEETIIIYIFHFLPLEKNQWLGCEW